MGEGSAGDTRFLQMGGETATIFEVPPVSPEPPVLRTKETPAMIGTVASKEPLVFEVQAVGGDVEDERNGRRKEGRKH